jgi:type I site-specific restriction-modification system R (restriction) subunit
MIRLNLPPCAVSLTKKNGKQLIFDPLRRRHVALTPEEWVRQHFVNYLITEKNYPKERIANEVCINVNNTSKRCDTIVYDNFLNPLVIIEYKAPSVPINNEVFNQTARYNFALRVQYIIVSNGLVHYCCNLNYDEMKFVFLKDIPFFNEISK